MDSDSDISQGGGLAKDEKEVRGRETHRKKKKKSDETRKRHKHKKKHKKEKRVREDKEDRIDQGEQEEQERGTDRQEELAEEDKDEGGTRGDGSVNHGVVKMEERVANHTEVEVLTPHKSLSLTPSLAVMNNSPPTIHHDAVIPEDLHSFDPTAAPEPFTSAEPLQKFPSAEPLQKSPSAEPLQKSPVQNAQQMPNNN